MGQPGVIKLEVLCFLPFMSFITTLVLLNVLGGNWKPYTRSLESWSGSLYNRPDLPSGLPWEWNWHHKMQNLWGFFLAFIAFIIVFTAFECVHLYWEGDRKSYVYAGSLETGIIESQILWFLVISHL